MNKKIEVCPIMLEELVNELKWKRKQVNEMSEKLEIFDNMLYLATIERPNNREGRIHPCPIEEMESALTSWRNK